MCEQNLLTADSLGILQFGPKWKIDKQSSSYDPSHTSASTSDCKIPYHGNKAQKNVAAIEMSQISTCCNC